jgi:putative endonuclease
MDNLGYVYILQSQVNKSYYIGSAKDIENRFTEHQIGKVPYTINLRPLELKFYQKYDTIKEAKQIEYKLKRLKSRKIIDQIIKDKEIRIK